MAWVLQFSALGQVSVLTGHNDIGRTGANTQETILTPASVGSGNFQKLLRIRLNANPAQVRGQPLIVPGVKFGGVAHNVLIVTDSSDDVFAFDADNGAQLWHITLLDAAHGAGPDAVNDSPTPTPCQPNVNTIRIGIAGTPAIDAATGTIYLEGLTWENNYAVHRIHALDITTGEEKFGAPTTIQATVSGTGWDSDSLGHLNFDPETSGNRTGLLLLNGIVYIAYAATCEGDTAGWHGWVIAYDATTMRQTGAWATTPDGTGSGIWMSGAALAADVVDPINQPFGRMFVALGNGSFNAVPPYTSYRNFGDDFVRLDLTNGTLTPQDSFTVSNQANLVKSDGDLGSGGVLLLPDSAGSALHPHLLVQGSKAGTIFLVDRDNMGGYNTTDNIVQELTGVFPQGLFSAPAYWNGNLYFWAPTDYLKAFSITNGVMSQAPTSLSPVTAGYPGATPIISANDDNDGIVWALAGGGKSSPTFLAAYDATNVATQLYSSVTNDARDNPGARSNNSVATVANGKVYVGYGDVFIYGSMFTVSAQSTTMQGSPGSSPTVTVNVASPSGSSFSGTVALSATELPAGVTVTFSSPTLALGQSPTSGSSLMTLNIPNTTEAGYYPFHVIGASGSLLSSVAFSLTVGGTSQPQVPNVVGLTLANAETTISGAGLVIGTVTTVSNNTTTAGDVISESPLAGTSVNVGSAVNLVVSSGSTTTQPSSSAKYNGLDTVTQGTWTGKYGTNGELIANSTAGLPSYGTVNVTGNKLFTWATSTSDVRALQVSSGSTSRIASTYYSYSNFTIDVNLTDGNKHNISLYLLSWDSPLRSENISILDAATNTVLDEETISIYQKNGGEYASWSIQGHVLIRVALISGNNAVVSGIFFDSAASATYTGLDTTTQGTWTGKYGTGGEVIANDVNNIPASATVTLSGDKLFTWAATTSDARGLQISSGSTSRIASTFYANSSFTIDVNFTDGNVHKISLYLLSWDSPLRSESISILDAGSNTILDGKTFSIYQKNGGEYASWNIQGHVLIQVTLISGNNPVVSGIFFN